MCVALLDPMSARFVLREAKVVSGCMTLANLLSAAERDGVDHFVVLEKADVVGVIDVRNVRRMFEGGASPHSLVRHVMQRGSANVVLEDGRVVGVLEAIDPRSRRTRNPRASGTRDA
jgi:hypothetical protein